MKAKDLYPSVFSRHAEAYRRRLDAIMARGEARGRVRMLELAGARRGMRVLDLACGPGTLTKILLARVSPGGAVVGVDLARGMVESAHRSVKGASFAVMDMEALGFASTSFDAAVCGHGLQFASDLPRALGEVRRVLRRRAPLAASIPSTALKDSVWGLLDSVVERHLPPAPEVVDNVRTRETVRDAEALRQAAVDAGFGEVEVEAVDEVVVWPSAEVLVSELMGWWDFAYRMEELSESRREAFTAEALSSLKARHPGAIETHGRTLVVAARA